LQVENYQLLAFNICNEYTNIFVKNALIEMKQLHLYAFSNGKKSAYLQLIVYIKLYSPYGILTYDKVSTGGILKLI
jgi:hypothetical protein